MQRLARDTISPDGSLDLWTQNLALLTRHLPQAVADLYATPRLGKDNMLEWWSPRGGQPVHFSQLDAPQRKALLEQYTRRQESIAQAAQALAGRGQNADAERLRGFLFTQPDPDRLYSVDGAPVLTRWADLKADDPAAIPPGEPIVRSTSPAANRKWLLPLALLLLLSILTALAVWWLLYRTPSAPFTPASTPASPASPIALTPAAHPVCAPVAGPPPEKRDFVVVLDTSGSMALNIGATNEDEAWFFKTINQRQKPDPSAIARIQALRQEPTRYRVAVDAMSTMLQDLPSDIDTTLITYAGCGQPVKQGTFNSSQRDSLIQALHRLSPDDGTPMAASLRAAADMVDGVERDAVIVMFVDGEDGCQENQCAIAEAIAKAKPRLKVNVVDLTGSQLSSCVAKSTGGQVFSSQDASLIPELLRKASTDALSATQCTPG